MIRRFAVLTSLSMSVAGCQFELLKTESGPEPMAGPVGGAPNEPDVVIEGEWVPAMMDLSDLTWNCGPVPYITSHPAKQMLIAGVSKYGLWSSSDAGKSWDKLGQGDDSDELDHRPSSIVFDPDDPDTFWVSGIYGTTALSKTEDGGKTFKHLGHVMTSDSITIDFTDPDRRTMLASSHEVQELYKSTDSGASWEDIAENLPSGLKVCAYPLILDADTYLLGCGPHGQGDAAILRSTDGGDSWDQVHDDGGAALPLVASDGTIYWTREPRNGVVSSSDDGKTWVELPRQGVVQAPLVELPDSRIAVVTSTDVLAWDRTQWDKVAPPLPYMPSGFTFSKEDNAFFVSYQNCTAEPVPAASDAIVRFSLEE